MLCVAPRKLGGGRGAVLKQKKSKKSFSRHSVFLFALRLGSARGCSLLAIKNKGEEYGVCQKM